MHLPFSVLSLITCLKSKLKLSIFLKLVIISLLIDATETLKMFKKKKY